jgi:fibronectin-binding autotransporter adhesin
MFQSIRILAHAGRKVACVTAGIFLAGGLAAHAQTNQTWSGGANTWDNGITADWTGAVWTNGNNADFSAGGAATVNGTVIANEIIDNNNPIEISGAGTTPILQLGAGGMNIQGGGSNFTIDNTVALQLTASQAWLDGNNAGLVINANITEAGAGGYTVTQQNTSSYSGKSVYFGGTNVFTNFTILSNNSQTAYFTANSTTVSNINLNSGNNSSTIEVGNSSTAAALNANTVTLTGSGTAAIELGQAGTFTVGSNGGSSTIASVISDQSGTAANQTGALVQAGTGTLTLTGANTFHGTTAINAGAINVANAAGTSALGSSLVSINSTGTLTGGSAAAARTTGLGGATSTIYSPGVGAVTGPVTLFSGGALAPGNAGIGTMTLGAFTINSGGLLNYEFSGSANDFTSAGALTLNGGTFNLYAVGTTNPFAAVGTYDLIGYTSLTGAATSLTVGDEVAGYSYTFVNDTADDLVQLDVTAAAAPEPGTWAMLALGLVGLVAFQSRRNRFNSNI